MASKLKGARDQITADWEALTPPTTARRTYRKIGGKELLDGASGHRTFYFLPPETAAVAEFASSFTVYRYEFDARLQLSSAGLGLDATFDQVVDEAVLFVNAVNERASWPAGVRMIQANGYSVEEVDSDDFDVILPIVAEIEEE